MDSRGNGKNAPRPSRFRVLKNEPRVVTRQTIRRLEESGASRDLIDAAERAARTNPS